MNILVSMNSFKGCLSALAASGIVANELQKLNGVHNVDLMPLVDGGTGSLEAWAHLMHLDCTYIDTVDPAGYRLRAPILVQDQTAYIEMASSSGLHLNRGSVDILQKNTYGTGLLIRRAIELGCQTIYVGLGGSATHDLGTGILQALGVKFHSASGQELTTPRELLQLDHINDEALRNVNDRVRLYLLCDVNSPLTGPLGAAAVFAPQKGAVNDTIISECERLSQVFVNYFADLGITIGDKPGDGAAGGIPALLRTMLNAQTLSGVAFTASLVNLADNIENYDLIISGEGQFDEQSFYGKGPGYLIELCSDRVPVIILTGSYKHIVSSYDNLSIFSIIPHPASLAEALNQAEGWLADTARNAVKLFINGYKKRCPTSNTGLKPM